MASKVKKEYYDFVPSVVATMERPPSRLARMISWIILLFCTIAIAWLYLAKVDIVISAQGKIVPFGKIKVVQSADEGVVRQIFVKDGQTVKAGDELIELDNTSPVADKQQFRNNLAQAQLKVQRLRSELGEPIELGKGVETSEEIVNTERALFESNQAAFDEQLTLLEHELNQATASLAVLRSETNKLRGSIDHLKTKLEQKRAQAELGLVPKEEVNDIEFELMSTKEDLVALGQRIEEQKAKVRGAEEKIQATRTDRKSKLYAELTEAEHELTSVNQELIKAEERISYQTLKAPVDGVVQQLTVNTIGGVVTKAQDLMVIVPEDIALEMEAQILNKDIGFVNANQPVKVKVDAFEFTRYGTLEGDIEWIGADAIVDEEKGPIYPARIALKETVLPNKVNNRIAEILPGMNATIDIVIGQRRLIEYFIGPILRYKDESLRER